ncbi:MAG: tRNA uridine-5-carboxymethylaminomethyl(34) synthesis GTPase MnmE, partial [Rhodospirillaceae bacterium]|nr:tRNA uridine-5-carboxymethylaminomethyl(34) synthesis GTPase MnmE [Rhodospirillaceae bacterium]
PELDGETVALINDDAVVCINKSDKLSGDVPQNISSLNVFSVSVKTGDGMDALLSHIEKRLEKLLRVSGDAPLPTRERHRHALVECGDALQRFINDKNKGIDELAAEDLRLAVRALGHITGRVGVEELLDIIFSEFCIGK